MVKDDLARGGGGVAWLFTPPCQLRLGHLEVHAVFLFFVSDSSSISKFEEFLFYSKLEIRIWPKFLQPTGRKREKDSHFPFAIAPIGVAEALIVRTR